MDILFFIGKAIFLFVLTITVIRIMGNSTMAQLTAHDLTALVFVVTMAVSPLATDKMAYAIAGIAIVSIVHIFLSRITLIRWLNKILIGQPVIAIKHGKIIKANLRHSRFTLREMLSTVRAKGSRDIADIEYAILEPNGEISILPKQEAAPVTPKQLNLSSDYKGLPIAVVIEGKLQYKNLKLIHKNEQWLKQQLNVRGYPQLSDIFYATVRDSDHAISVDAERVPITMDIRTRSMQNNRYVLQPTPIIMVFPLNLRKATVKTHKFTE